MEVTQSEFAETDRTSIETRIQTAPTDTLHNELYSSQYRKILETAQESSNKDQTIRPDGFNHDFQITDQSITPVAADAEQAKENAETLEAENLSIAAEIYDALNPAFFSLRSGPEAERVFQALLNMTPEQYQSVDRVFTEQFGDEAKPWFFSDTSWSIADDIEAKLWSSESDPLMMLVESKQHNDVPLEHRVSGEQLLSQGSDLKVGEINPITLPDGRRFDVYIPQNADDRAPVIVAMHGAAAGDSIGLMAQESGLTADAERTGAIVVFAYPKPREFDTGLGNVTGVAWNAPDRMNLPSSADNQTNDYDYLDNVLEDLSTRSITSEEIGLFGFSDGGRFAQVYAADRPDRVAAIVSQSGTWMNGEEVPTVGIPAMIVHGDSDETLPYEGGTGSVSGKMDWMLGTNLDNSAPYMQAQVWQTADQCHGPVLEETQGNITERTYSGCETGEVIEYLIAGGEHAINDYRNDGNRTAQWLLGSPDRTLDFSTEGAQFLTRYIVSDQ